MKRYEWHDLGVNQMLVKENWVSGMAPGELAWGRKVRGKVVTFAFSPEYPEGKT